MGCLENKIESCVKVPSPWGSFQVYATDRGVTRLEFPGTREAKRAPSPAAPAPALRRASKALTEYFRGRKVDFSTLDFDLGAKTAFEKKVLRYLLRIQPGTILSYGELAASAGFPGAARAVGSAMRKNPLPVFIPCHRVFAAGRKIGGYAKGLEWKRRLLALEGIRLPPAAL